jgi:hypothetical protein
VNHESARTHGSVRNISIREARTNAEFGGARLRPRAPAAVTAAAAAAAATIVRWLVILLLPPRRLTHSRGGGSSCSRRLSQHPL